MIGAALSPDHAPPGLSGKTADQENFPVASRLLRPDLRAAVMRFYRIAREADDIADAPDLAPQEKLRRLDAIAAGLDPADPAGVHLGRLLQAFRGDAANRRCRDWNDLLTYCRFSAAPVGRFLVELHGEDAAAAMPAESLAMALQVLNHLQDLKEDWQRLRRSYLPERWLAEAGLDSAAADARLSSPALRSVVGRMLDGTDKLLAAAKPLPGLLHDPGLRAQAAATLVLARRLRRRLGRADPLRRRVALSRVDWLAAAIGGLRAGGWAAVRRVW